MTIKTVHGIFFSATGSTEKIVTCVTRTTAKLLDAEYKSYSFSLPEARAQTLTFSKEDLVVLGVPVYAGRVPNLLLPYIKEKVCGNGTPATLITLFGNRSFDDALIELCTLMQGNGFCAVSAGAFVGEHSFSAVLGAGRPDDDDIALAVKLSKETALKIANMASQPAKTLTVAGDEPFRPYYTPRDRHGNPINILKVKPKTDKSKCVNCGLCADICTMGSISPDDTSEITGICTKCNACVKNCPARAKYYDDEGYLYHLHELEDVYKRRATVELFY